MKAWSRKFKQCIKCGTTKTPHEQHGMCKRCWDIKVYRKYKAYYSSYYKEYYKKHKAKIKRRNKAYYKSLKPMPVCTSPSK